MTWLIVWLTFIATIWMLFSINKPRHRPLNDERPMFMCPYCRRWTSRVETVDWESDVLQYHCDWCRGFMGARAVGTDLGDSTEILVKDERGT